MLTLLATLALAPEALAQQSAPQMLPVGKLIQPAGRHVGVGSYPVNMAATPDGEKVVVTDIGFRQALTVLSKDGKLLSRIEVNKEVGNDKEGLYYGLAFRPPAPNVRMSGHALYASRGAEDKIAPYIIDSKGTIRAVEGTIANPSGDKDLPNHPAGIAFSSDGSRLYVANNQTGLPTNFVGSVSVISMADGGEEKRILTRGFPFALAAITKGAAKDKKVYVASERDGLVESLDVEKAEVKRQIVTGAQPEGLLLNESQSRLYVANAGSDTVSVVDTSTDKVLATILLRPTELRGLPGVAPTGMALSPDQKTLYVAMGDMNAVGVVDLDKNALVGMIPTGWLPTSLVAYKDHLLVACAKGVRAMNPNGKPVGKWGQYIQDIIEGSVSNIPLGNPKQLEQWTRTVVKCNRLRPGLESASHPTFANPGIQHVIYVIKENRTYDNVLGDLKQGNGDPSICLFPRKVTPNQHALAERFVLLDNFYVCAEVSQDGWMWSTCGMVSPYASRNTPYNYSGRGRNYDTEGSNNNVPIDLLGIADVARPASGYIWDHCGKFNVTFRNYGFFTTFLDPKDKRYDALSPEGDNFPTKKALLGSTDVDFRRYDLNYADSEAWVKYDSPFPKQVKRMGRYDMPSRFSEWYREFKEFEAQGRMPRFQMIRFPVDHTAGTSAGMPTPEAMVADNDYAVGQLVEAVSKSQFWESTVVCILEDDAQAGYDHVDAHRSTAYLISPYIKKATVDHRFYNTDSMLRTMELLLGMPPMCQYDAVADPIDVFGRDLTNLEPFAAILPAKEIVTAVNKKTAYRQKDSAKISRWAEESAIDEDLNDILWGAIKGARTPRPRVVRSLGYRAGRED
ncbi:MAG: hypothetical protein HZC36_05005 [Armatimonadetes bacterium]|nr:hypothetical protein [Armatimonadota bacterium]